MANFYSTGYNGTGALCTGDTTNRNMFAAATVPEGYEVIKCINGDQEGSYIYTWGAFLLRHIETGKSVLGFVGGNTGSSETLRALNMVIFTPAANIVDACAGRYRDEDIKTLAIDDAGEIIKFTTTSGAEMATTEEKASPSWLYSGHFTHDDPPRKISFVPTISSSERNLIIASQHSIAHTGMSFIAPDFYTYPDDTVKTVLAEGGPTYVAWSFFALFESGKLLGWGKNRYNEISPEDEERAAPTTVLDNIASVAARKGAISCVDFDGRLRLWGSYANYYAASESLPASSTAKFYDTTPILEGCKSVFMIADGVQKHTLFVLKNDNSIWVNGYNRFGQAGTGNNNDAIGFIQIENPYGGPVEINGYYDTAYLIGKTENSITIYNADGETIAGRYSSDFPIEGITITEDETTRTAHVRITNTAKESKTIDINYGVDKFLGLSFAQSSIAPEIKPGHNDIEITGAAILYVCVAQQIETILYSNKAEPNRVNKTSYLREVGRVYGNFRASTSITDIVLYIAATEINFNYIKIPAFNRYYFVNDIAAVRSGFWSLSCSVDVLMTYQTLINKAKGNIERQETQFNDYIIDNRRAFLNRVERSDVAISNNVFGQTLTSQDPLYAISGFYVGTYER